MFYYTVDKKITNIYDGQPLVIRGNVSVYNDEAKTQLITQMPFSEIGVNLTFSECPHDTVEQFNDFVDNTALTAINKPEIQDKLNEIKIAYDLGLV